MPTKHRSLPKDADGLTLRDRVREIQKSVGTREQFKDLVGAPQLSTVDSWLAGGRLSFDYLERIVSKTQHSADWILGVPGAQRFRGQRVSDFDVGNELATFVRLRIEGMKTVQQGMQYLKGRYEWRVDPETALEKLVEICAALAEEQLHDSMTMEHVSVLMFQAREFGTAIAKRDGPKPSRAKVRKWLSDVEAYLAGTYVGAMMPESMSFPRVVALERIDHGTAALPKVSISVHSDAKESSR